MNETKLLEKIARAICKAKGVEPEFCVFGTGSISSTRGASIMECHRRAWEDELPSARAALAAMRDGEEWQPIETKPTDGTPVMLRYQKSDPFGEPTHWRPLPAPPAPGGE